jgi:hypothetical protein
LSQHYPERELPDDLRQEWVIPSRGSQNRGGGRP